MSQPTIENPNIAVLASGSVTSQTTEGIGRHCQNKRTSARLASSTYVLRSTDFGTYCVHQFLNCLRAITLCCTANNDIKSRLTMIASEFEPTVPESIVLGTIRPDTKPMAYRKVTKNIA